MHGISWRLVIAAGAAMLAAASAEAAAYVLVLKDGSALMVQEPYTVEGRRAIFRSLDGNLQSLPLSEIDAARTREANSAEVTVVPHEAPGRVVPSKELGPPSQTPPAGGKVYDNFALREFRGARLNTGGEGAGQGAAGGEEGEKTAPPSLEDIRAKEAELKVMVDALNAKVEESAARGSSNLPAQKKLEEEVNQMRAAYEKEWQSYSETVNQYNTYLRGDKPSAEGEEGAPAVGSAPSAEREAGEEEESGAAPERAEETEESAPSESFWEVEGEPIDSVESPEEE
jgi:hypothetical protein